MLDRLKDTVAKMPFGGTMAVVVGLVEGTAGEVIKAVPLRRRHPAKPETPPAPTDVTPEGDADPAR